MKIKHEKIKSMTAICFINGSIVVTGHQDGTICVWDLSLENHLVRSWKGHDIEPYYKTASITTLLKIDENTFASGAHDCHIKLWNVVNGALIKDLSDTGYITALQLRGINEIVSSSVYNSYRSNMVRVWNYSTGQNRWFCPDGKALGVNAGAHWRCPIGTIVLEDQSIAFTTYNEALGGRAVVKWDPEKQTHTWHAVEHQNRIDSILRKKDGFVTISGDLSLKVWSALNTNNSLTTHKVAHSGVLGELDSKHWVCLGPNRVSVLNQLTGQSIATFEVHSAFYHHATVCQDIWIRLDDTCIFKINMMQFLKFAELHGADIHNYLFSACGSSIKKSYIDCNLPQLGPLLLKENEIINSELKETRALADKLSSALKDSQQAQSELVNQAANLREELNLFKKSALDALLLEAARMGNFEKVKHLLALDANPNAKNQQGESVVLLSMQHNHYDVASLLLERGVDLTAIDDKGNTLIDNMALAANFEMLAMLIGQHSKIKGIGFLKQAYNKIRDALPDEHYDPVRKLLSDSMLKIAVKQDNLDEVMSLFKNFNVDINAQDLTKETALHKAAYLSYENIVRFLLLHGAQTDIKDKNGSTAIQVAAGDNIVCLIQHVELLRGVQKGNYENLQNLMEQYANLGLNAYSHQEDTNLLVAAIKLPNPNESQKILKLLLHNGANPNIAVDGSTPLHYAVDIGDKGTIQLLIQAKVVKGNKNQAGERVIEYARRIGQAKLADYMIKLFAVEKDHMKKANNSNGYFARADDSNDDSGANKLTDTLTP